MAVRHLDPTRTTLLRRQFILAMRARFNVLQRLVKQKLVDEDALGLQQDSLLHFNVEKGVWRFKTDAQKMDSFKTWMQERIDEGVLQKTAKGDPWTNTYVESAYRKGVVRAYTDSNRAQVLKPADFVQGSREQFLRQAFAAPETVSKLQLISTRAYEQLRGITQAMAQQMSFSLAEGIANGYNPTQIARNMVKSISGIEKSRAERLARTEVIYAHSEGQLDSFEMLGVEEVGVMAEWLTAGDDRVCEECAELEGAVMTIAEARGLIPRHPNCRCCWIPANVGEKRNTPAKTLHDAVGASLKAEVTKAKTIADAAKKSSWAGKALLGTKTPTAPATVAKGFFNDWTDIELLNKQKVLLSQISAVTDIERKNILMGQLDRVEQAIKERKISPITPPTKTAVAPPKPVAPVKPTPVAPPVAETGAKVPPAAPVKPPVAVAPPPSIRTPIGAPPSVPRISRTATKTPLRPAARIGTPAAPSSGGLVPTSDLNKFRELGNQLGIRRIKTTRYTAGEAADFKKFTTTASRNAIQALNRTKLKKYFPKNHKFVNELDFKNAERVRANGVGVFVPNTRKLELANPLKSGEALGEAILKHEFVTDNSFAGTVRHELGHAVQKAFDQNAKTKLFSKEWESIVNRSKDLKTTLSRYGATNPREAFAEAFCSYTSPKYVRGFLPIEMEAFLDRWIGGLL